VLHCRAKTTGIIETQFEMETTKFMWEEFFCFDLIFFSEIVCFFVFVADWWMLEGRGVSEGSGFIASKT
jgi:hypothetical protein